MANEGELYTPITMQVLELLDEMIRKYETGVMVSRESGLLRRQIARLRHSFDSPRSAKLTISLKVMDQLISATDVGSLHDFPWYTKRELIDRGVWRRPSGKREGRRPRR